MSRPARQTLSLPVRAVCSGLALFIGSVAVAEDSGQAPELLSNVMQRISGQPEFRERLLGGIHKLPHGGEFLSPELLRRLRVLILGREWQRVDRFPALPVAALNQTVSVTEHVAGPNTKPLAPEELLDVGDYPLNQAESIDLDRPATAPRYADDPATAQHDLGFHLTMGDGPDPALAPMHAQSRQLAFALNRLAMNAPGRPQATAQLHGKSFTEPSSLMGALLQDGHHVTITDTLYFANFGHLHDHGREVMMPFWIDTQIAVPASRRSLLLPVSHSEPELHIRGPKWNADVSFYFGIDGKAEFRTMDSLNQSWVMHRAVFTYVEPQALEHGMALLSAAIRVYHRVRLAHPELPFGGYYRLGVCQDVGAAMEYVLQGRVVLFPITHDPSYFQASEDTDPRDREFLAAFAAIPSDRGSRLPPIDRVLGALPAAHYSEIVIPGLASDLDRVLLAQRLGLLQRTHPLLSLLAILVALSAGAAACGGLVLRRRRWRRATAT